VPIILAVTIMAKNPTQYGLEHLDPEPPLAKDKVTINYPVDLRLVAECVDSSVATLQELNPSLLRMTTPKDGSFDLALPAGTSDKFQQAIAAIPKDMRVWWRYHKVTAGETLAQVAKQYHATQSAIAEVNSLPSGELTADTKLIIPAAPGHRVEAASGSYAKRPTSYHVRKGDTVLSVADDFGVPAEKIRKWNGLRGNTLRAGRTLKIYKPVAGGEEEQTTASKSRTSSGKKSAKANSSSSLPASKKSVVRHKVKRGETLSSIASRYNTTVSVLKRDNSHVARLKPGDVLLVRTE
jgi:membrane-bound lytic murein transglycosylase D